MNKIEEILLLKYLESLNIKSENVLGIYNYGSILYSCFTEKSDLDYVIVVKNFNEYNQLESETLDLHILSDIEFNKRLFEHDIMMLECFYQENPIRKYSTNFELDLHKLRSMISSKSNNSYVKSKKKLIDNEKYIAMKSMFHSFRLLYVGIDIASNKKVNFNFLELFYSTRDLFEQTNYDWDKINIELKQKYNKLATEFKILAPKKIKG